MKILNSLLRYGRTSEENYNQIVTWHNEAIQQIAEGNGFLLASASGSGQAFSNNLAFTVIEWSQVLCQALDMLESGKTRLIKKAYIRF